MKLRKRSISLLLSAVMALGLCLPAAAEEDLPLLTAGELSEEMEGGEVILPEEDPVEEASVSSETNTEGLSEEENTSDADSQSLEENTGAESGQQDQEEDEEFSALIEAAQEENGADALLEEDTEEISETLSSELSLADSEASSEEADMEAVIEEMPEEEEEEIIEELFPEGSVSGEAAENYTTTWISDTYQAETQSMSGFISWMLNTQTLTALQIADLEKAQAVIEDAETEAFSQWYGGTSTGFPEERNGMVTVLGDTKDALMLTNVKQSLSVMYRINELRNADTNYVGGMARIDSYTNFYLMAVALTGADRGAGLKRHSLLQVSCENLCFNYASPADAWYSEIGLFNECMANVGVDAITNEKYLTEVEDEADNLGYTIGHYRNLFWAREQVMGVGFCNYGTTYCYNATALYNIEDKYAYYTLDEFSDLLAQYQAALKAGTDITKKTNIDITYYVEGEETYRQTKAKGETIQLITDTPKMSGSFSLINYSFAGWSTTENGSAEYKSGEDYSGNEDLNLYAVFLDNSTLTHWTINYYYEDGSFYNRENKYEDVDLIFGRLMGEPVKYGYTLLGWATSKGGPAVYHDGDRYTENAGLNLYAVWASNAYKVSGSEMTEITITQGYNRLQIIPLATGYYHFETDNLEKGKLLIYDVNDNLLASDSSGYVDLTMKLTAGVRYNLYFRQDYVGWTPDTTTRYPFYITPVGTLNATIRAITPKSETSVGLHWDRVAGASSYTLYRYNETSGSYEFLAESTGNSYTDTGLTSGKTYFYKIKASGTAYDGSSFPSNLSPAKGVTVPLPNTTITSIKSGWSGVMLKWDLVKGAKKYRVYRKAEDESEWTLLTTTGSNGYYDKTAKNNTYYSYMVNVGTGNLMLEQNIQTIRHYSCPVIQSVTNVAGGVTVKWGAVAGANGYYVYRKDTQSGTWRYLGSTKEVSYTDKNAVNGTVHYYAVKAYGIQQGVSASSSAKNTIYLKNNYLSEYSVPSDGVLKLTVSSNPKAAGYSVKYSTSSSMTNPTFVKFTSVTGFLKGLKKGTTYYMQVRCYRTVAGYTFYSAWSAVKHVTMRDPDSVIIGSGSSSDHPTATSMTEVEEGWNF